MRFHSGNIWGGRESSYEYRFMEQSSQYIKHDTEVTGVFIKKGGSMSVFPIGVFFSFHSGKSHKGGGVQVHSPITIFYIEKQHNWMF